MIEDKTVEIQINKKEHFKMLFGSLVFVILGIWYMTNPVSIEFLFFNNKTIIFIIGLLSVVFFGVNAIYLAKKLFDKSPGLIISSDGVFYNSSAVSVGFIPWTDIKEIKVTKVFTQSFINLVLKNPHKYIENHSRTLKGKLIKINKKTFNAPIAISANGLRINFTDLKLLIEQNFAKSKFNQI